MNKTSGRRLLAGSLLASACLLVTAVAAFVPIGDAGAIPICQDPPCPLPTTRTTRRPTTTTRPPNTFTWAIDANSLLDHDNQETFSDEAYIAQIGFRTKPGVPGSTQTWYQGGLTEIGDLDEGETHTIPDSMGRVMVPNVRTRTQAELAAGQSWEIIGSLSIVFESDLTPFSTVNGLMQDLTVAARGVIANAVEPLPAIGVSDPLLVAQVLQPLGDSINSDVSLSLAQKIAIFIGSAGDPDDKIAVKVNFFAGLDSSYALLDSLLGIFVTDDDGFAGTLYDQSYSQIFAGDGARYEIAYQISHF
jgi:hypothetical protein